MCKLSVTVSTGLGAIGIKRINLTNNESYDNVSSTVVNETVPCGLELGISASPFTGYTFIGWSCNSTGCYNGQLENYTLVMNGSIKEYAQFIHGQVSSQSSGGSIIGAIQNFISSIVGFFQHL